MTELLLDAVGRRRSPATLSGFPTGRPPRGPTAHTANASRGGCERSNDPRGCASPPSSCVGSAS